MIVQRCIKGILGGVDGIADDEARNIIDGQWGILCRWWRNVRQISPPEIRGKLTQQNLNMHVNQYYAIDPATKQQFCEGTPFISLSAGSVERSTFLQTNITHPAHMTALDFATNGGATDGYLFYCWVVVGLRPAVEVENVAEEVRELNTYRRYSPYQTEGEITAKIIIPSNQIQRCEKYSLSPSGGLRLCTGWPYYNSKFDDPINISNIRELF